MSNNESPYIFIRSRCPICGKWPKVRPIRRMDDSGFFYTFAIVRCKPFLRVAHLEAVASHPAETNAVYLACDEWERLCNPKKNVESNKGGYINK